MKKLFLIAISILPAFVFAQTQGNITYEEKIEVNIDSMFKGREQYRQYMTPEMMEMFKKMQSQKKTLLFNEHASYYKDYEKPEEEGLPETEEGGGHGGMGRWARMMNMRPMQQVYQDLDSMKAIEQQEFLEKKFLIKSVIEPRSWKLSSEQKKIAGYDCVKATFKDTLMDVEAWFTMQIPVPAGPASFGQLPGMILEATIVQISKDSLSRSRPEEGKVVITATSIDLTPLKANSIAPPKQGKEVTKEEYKKIVEEKIKEMRSMYRGQQGGGGRIEVR